MPKEIENAEVTAKDVKNLKIKYIDILDFKNIESINAELEDWNVIGGYNGNGKSSFVEGILTAVQGQKFFGTGKVAPASLVKKGENKAVIRVVMQGEEVELSIHREFKKGTTKNPAGKTELIAEMNGQKITQKSLDTLLGSLTLDPLKLGELSIAEQIKEIKATINLDTDAIDKEIKDAEEDRKESGHYKTKTDAIYQDMIGAGVPQKVEKKSVSSLVEDRTLVEKKNRKLQEMKEKEAEIEAIKKKLETAESELSDIKKEGTDLYNQVKEKGLGTIEEIDTQIENIEEENKAFHKYEKYLDAKKQRDDAREDWEKDEEKVKSLRSKRTKIIAESDIPEYMEISDELGIIVDGTEYNLLNTAKKIEVAIDLVLISGSPLRMIRIEQGGELDVKTLEKIKDKIIENNFQIFIERPIIDKFDSIIISDGGKIEDNEDFISKQ